MLRLDMVKCFVGLPVNLTAGIFSEVVGCCSHGFMKHCNECRGCTVT